MKLALNGTTAVLVVDNEFVLSYVFDPRVDADGYTYGLNTGMVGLGTNNSRGRIDNVKVQVLPREISFDRTDEFVAGSPNLVSGYSDGQWQVQDGRLIGTPAPGEDKAIALVDLRLPDGLQPTSIIDLEAVIQTQSFGGLVFDEYAPDHFKFVALLPDTDQVVIGHHTARGGWAFDEVATWALESGTDYELEIAIRGTSVSVMVDGETVAGFVFNALSVDGKFGLLTGEGGTSFDSLRVKTDDVSLYGRRFGGRRTEASSGEDVVAVSVDPVTATAADIQTEETAQVAASESVDGQAAPDDVLAVEPGMVALPVTMIMEEETASAPVPASGSGDSAATGMTSPAEASRATGAHVVEPLRLTPEPVSDAAAAEISSSAPAAPGASLPAPDGEAGSAIPTKPAPVSLAANHMAGWLLAPSAAPLVPVTPAAVETNGTGGSRPERPPLPALRWDWTTRRFLTDSDD
jgi:hypothetical protein